MLKIGDKVYMDGYTSIAQSGCSMEDTVIIKKDQTRYNEKTGKPFKIVRAFGEWWYAENGSSYTNKNSMYYITK